MVARKNEAGTAGSSSYRRRWKESFAAALRCYFTSWARRKEKGCSSEEQLVVGGCLEPIAELPEAGCGARVCCFLVRPLAKKKQGGEAGKRV